MGSFPHIHTARGIPRWRGNLVHVFQKNADEILFRKTLRPGYDSPLEFLR
jgi:hypothetical protein